MIGEDPEEKRAPVQGDGPYWTPLDNWMRKKERTQVPGSIAWSEHLEIWEVYAQKYGRSQSAERLAQRGGFGFYEIEFITGKLPKTWKPSPRYADMATPLHGQDSKSVDAQSKEGK